MNKREFVKRQVLKVISDQLRRFRRRVSPDERRIKYLEDVFSLYTQLRHDFAHLNRAKIAKMISRNDRSGTHIIRLLIDVTAGNVDDKRKEQWTRGLRYADRCRQGIQTRELQDECEPCRAGQPHEVEDDYEPHPATAADSFGSFLHKNGGIEGCARKMSKHRWT